MKIACGWLYSLCTFGYPPNFEDTLKGITLASKWGFEAFEMEAIGEENLHELYARRKELKAHIDSLGLTLANFVPVIRSMVSLDPVIQKKSLDLFELGLDLAADLDAKVVMTDSYEVPIDYTSESPADDPIHYGKGYRVKITPEFSWDRIWDNMISVMSKSALMCEKRGLRLGMEMRLAETVSNTDAFLRLYDAVRNPCFGVVFDTGHLNAQKEILPVSIEKLKDRIFLLHAADNDSTVNSHLALGDGTIDWESILAALKKHHFDGYITLDIGDCPDLDQAYIRSKKYLENLGV
jgi:sugar phosphate isomerase/epimerase